MASAPPARAIAPDKVPTLDIRRRVEIAINATYSRPVKDSRKSLDSHDFGLFARHIG
jgi:hypothetical protein